MQHADVRFVRRKFSFCIQLTQGENFIFEIAAIFPGKIEEENVTEKRN
jgi:hypothetical protein